MSQYFEKQDNNLENIYLTWEVIAGVHGVELNIPYLQEKRQQEKNKQQKKNKPIPLHLQFLKAGAINIKK